VKLRQLLKYYDVPFQVVNGKKKGSPYQKIPVLLASGRQINDSYVIFKNLVPVLCGQSFDDEWQNKITYQLQPSIEIEVMQDKGDMAKFMNQGFGAPKWIASCIAGPAGKKISKSIAAKNPGLPKPVDIGKEFAAKMGSGKFFAGDNPGQVDIAYYGTLRAFDWCGTQTAITHLQETGLDAWWSRMKAVMPDVMVK